MKETTTENSKDNHEYRREIIIAITFVIVIIVVWAGSWYLIDKNIAVDANDTRGTFGDKFGAINSLFSGLAFAGIIFTILLQRKELQLQRHELESTRKVFETQNEMLSQEKFENTFFQLLTLFHSIVNSLDLERKTSEQKIISTGRDCFQTFYNVLHNHVLSILNKENGKIDPIVHSYLSKDTLEISNYIKAYDGMYGTYRSDLSHYFRTFYHIIKFIDLANIDEKRRYISIARAQLSSYEQILLFYNCIHPNGNEKFKPLIEKYALFKNLDSSLLFSTNHKRLYKPSAYGN